MKNTILASLLLSALGHHAGAAMPTAAEHATLTKLSAALKAQAGQLRGWSGAKYSMMTGTGSYMFGGASFGAGQVRIRTNGFEYTTKMKSFRLKGGLGWGGSLNGENAIIVAKPGTPAEQIVPKLTVGIEFNVTAGLGVSLRAFRGRGAAGHSSAGGMGIHSGLMLEGGYHRIGKLPEPRKIRTLVLADGAAAHADKLMASGGGDVYKEIVRLQRFLLVVTSDNRDFHNVDGE